MRQALDFNREESIVVPLVNLEVEICKCVVKPMETSSVSSAFTMNAVRLAEASGVQPKAGQKTGHAVELLEVVWDRQEWVERVFLPHTNWTPSKSGRKRGQHSTSPTISWWWWFGPHPWRTTLIHGWRFSTRKKWGSLRYGNERWRRAWFWSIYLAGGGEALIKLTVCSEIIRYGRIQGPLDISTCKSAWNRELPRVKYPLNNCKPQNWEQR